MPYVITRNKLKHFKRRIPAKYRPYYNEKIEFIQISLETDSDTIAEKRALVLNEKIEHHWNQSFYQQQSIRKPNLKMLRDLTQQHGFQYKSTQEIAQSDLTEIVNRILVTKHEIGEAKQASTPILLGNIQRNAFPISSALEEYFEFEVPNLRNKSPEQVRKWKNPRLRAIGNFINVCGDLSIEALRRSHLTDLRKYWEKRIIDEGLLAGSANKDFQHLRSLICFIADNHEIEIDVNSLFARIRFSEEHEQSDRPPFETDFIQKTLLNPINLQGLDSELRWFLYAMADTGARPGELLGLNFKLGHIRLDTDIPYIDIRPEKDRALKTKQSQRQIPLVGTSLYAFQNLPDGFRKYYRKSDQLSAQLNRFLRENDLLPTASHCVYSLRHSFEDRLTTVEPPDKVQAALMGHKYKRERYGKGPSLEQKKKWLDKIALRLSGD